MRKSLFAFAAMAAFSALSIDAPVSAAPGMIGAVAASTHIVDVRMDDTQAQRGRHGVRGHRQMRGHMMRHRHRHHRM
jgi:hypothetical protein